MYSNKYHNIFAYYQRSKSDEAKIWTLEDNATKALVNVLEGIQSNSICEKKSDCISAFLKMLCPNTKCGFKGPYSFQLQVENPDICIVHKSYIRLLLIRPQWNSFPLGAIKGAKSTPGTRLDALIAGRSFALGCECKIHEATREGQLRGHCQALGIRPSRKQIVEVTWDVISKNLDNILSGCKQPSSICRFLISQFSEFLQDSNLNGFMGFTSEDFEYLAKSEDRQRKHADQRFSLQTKFDSLVGEVFDTKKLGYKEFTYPSVCLKHLKKRREYLYSVFTKQEIPKKVRSSLSEKQEHDYILRFSDVNAHIELGLDEGCFAVYAGAKSDLVKEIAKNWKPKGSKS